MTPPSVINSGENRHEASHIGGFKPLRALSLPDFSRQTRAVSADRERILPHQKDMQSPHRVSTVFFAVFAGAVSETLTVAVRSVRVPPRPGPHARAGGLAPSFSYSKGCVHSRLSAAYPYLNTFPRFIVSRHSTRVKTSVQPWNGTSVCSGNRIPADPPRNRTTHAQPVRVPGVRARIC